RASNTVILHVQSPTTRCRGHTICLEPTTNSTGKWTKRSDPNSNLRPSDSDRSFCSPATGSWRGPKTLSFNQNRTQDQDRSGVSRGDGGQHKDDGEAENEQPGRTRYCPLAFGDHRAPSAS